MKREIKHLVSQMGAEDLRAYFIESLFLNRHIRERQARALLKKLGKK